MGEISIFHWLIVVVYIAVLAVPIAKILSKAGYSGWWTIAAFVPLLNLVLLYVFAFSRWPREN